MVKVSLLITKVGVFVFLGSAAPKPASQWSHDGRHVPTLQAGRHAESTADHRHVTVSSLQPQAAANPHCISPHPPPSSLYSLVQTRNNAPSTQYTSTHSACEGQPISLSTILICKLQVAFVSVFIWRSLCHQLLAQISPTGSHNKAAIVIQHTISRILLLNIVLNSARCNMFQQLILDYIEYSSHE